MPLSVLSQGWLIHLYTSRESSASHLFCLVLFSCLASYIVLAKSMSLAEFVNAENTQEATLTVVNPDSECPVYRLLTRLFDEDAVTVHETTIDSEEISADTIVAEKETPNSGFAVSPLDAVRDELLFVNSDIYVTGARELDEVQTPDVITHLSEIPFTVTGYPSNSKEKLLLIEMSRHIEALAWQAGDGCLATGFQSLSRFDDEQGTRQVYTRLGNETSVNTHIYGVPDADPSLPGVTIHGEETEELRRTWFVVYDSPDHSHDAAALVAVQTEPNTWNGYWTYDTTTVADILTYLERTYD